MMRKWVWISAGLGLVLVIYVTKAVLLPFLAGFAVAYLLDPVTDRLEAVRVPRGGAAELSLLLFFLIAFGLVLLTVPIVQDQLAGLAGAIPGALADLRPWLNTQLNTLSETFGAAIPADVESLLGSFSAEILGQLQRAARGVLASSAALANILSLLLITPVVAFYLLRDWDKLTARLDLLLPHAQADVMRTQIKKIDEVLGGFVRGQLIISLIMAAIYAAGWTLVGLQNGLVLGLIAGLLAIIPFIGMLFGALLAMVMAISQWGLDPVNLGLVALVYVVVQVLEGAFLTPRLVGERVKLHPVWVLFAVFAGGEVMGFVGVLVAVPFAAAIAVLVRYALEEYQKSNVAGADHTSAPFRPSGTDGDTAATRTDPDQGNSDQANSDPATA